jgi:hypothetical protein
MDMTCSTDSSDPPIPFVARTLEVLAGSTTIRYLHARSDFDSHVKCIVRVFFAKSGDDNSPELPIWLRARETATQRQIGEDLPR